MACINWTQLIEDLRNIDDLECSEAARLTLSRVTDEADVLKLYELLNDDDFYIREAVAEPLAQLEGLKALPALFRALNRGRADGHDNDGLSFCITELLESKPADTAPLLLELIKDQAATTRANAAWALGFVAAEITADPLIKALSDHHLEVRSAAAGSLSSFKNDPRVVQKLLNALSENNEQLCVDVISSLGYLGDRAALPTLRNLLNDSRKRVRQFAEYAIKRLDGY